jgi:hypothetical protein
MIRLLLASIGLLSLGSMGAFFLFVPLLSIVAVICILLGLMLMFGLGVQVGTRGSRHLKA